MKLMTPVFTQSTDHFGRRAAALPYLALLWLKPQEH